MEARGNAAMSATDRFCFIITPFKPDLHYFSLYIQQYIERKPGYQCERADSKYLATSVPTKIDDYIQKANVIIADCSGSNANVFYELGKAHAFGKMVILITS